MISTFGFIVGAWLIILGGDSKLKIPFASLSACNIIKAEIIDSGYHHRFAFCAATGINPLGKVKSTLTLDK